MTDETKPKAKKKTNGAESAKHLSLSKKKQALTSIFAQVRNDLLSKAENWDESWDEKELEQLAYLAVSKRVPVPDKRKAEWREFQGHIARHNLV